MPTSSRACLVAVLLLVGAFLVSIPLAPPAHSQTVVATVPVGLSGDPYGPAPSSLAYDPAQGEVFVTNAGANTTSVISDATNTVAATVKFPGELGQIVYDSGKDELFMVDQGCCHSTLSVVSASTYKLVATLNLIGAITGLAYDSGTGEIFAPYLSGPAGNNVVLIISDVNDSLVGEVSIGRMLGNGAIVYDSGKGEIFVAAGNAISVISDSTDKVVATINAGGSLGAMAYDSGKGEIFAVVTTGKSGNMSQDISVISDASDSVVATIKNPPSNPMGMAYDSGTGEVYVTSNYYYFGGGSGSRSPYYPPSIVSVISDSSDEVVSAVPVQSGPSAIAYDSGKGEMFVLNSASDTVSVISNEVVKAASQRVAADPTSIAYDSARGELFVLNNNYSTVSVVNVTTDMVIATVKVGSGSDNSFNFFEANAVAYDPAKGEVFVTTENAYNNSVSVISDANDSVVATVPIGGPERVAGGGTSFSPFEAAGLAYDPAKGEIFVAAVNNSNPSMSAVFVISDANDSVVATVPLRGEPSGLAYDSGRGEVFVAISNNNSVCVISDATDKVVASVDVGSYPQGVAYDSSKGEIFVANAFNGTVSVISDLNDTVTKTVTLGVAAGYPIGVAYDSGSGDVFVASAQGNTVSVQGNTVFVISDSTNTVFLSVNVGAGPVNLAYDPSEGAIFVADSVAGTISTIYDASISPPATATTSESTSTNLSTVITSTSPSVFTVGAASGSGGGSGIPEFPGQVSLATLVTATIVGTYLLERRSRPRMS